MILEILLVSEEVTSSRALSTKWRSYAKRKKGLNYANLKVYKKIYTII
jgi:hypothetical protein